MERKIEIVSMELIKPLSPTPNHLRCFEFSYLDQMTIPVFAPLALFYPPPPSYSDHVSSSRLLVLKKSLSEILARFYPFAGRFKDNSIECSDEGVPFYEAFAHNYKFEDVHRKIELTKHFLPNIEGGSVFLNPAFPLLVQITNFACGGMAIGMCAYHKIADGATLSTLANAWAITSRGSCPNLPEFVAAAKFLPPVVPYVSNGLKLQFDFAKFFFNEQRVTKLFVFDGSTIASLKAKAISDVVHVPTRVEVVSALIWKCAMASSSGTGKKKLSKFAHQVNIRRRFNPPLPDHCVGNAVAVATAYKGENEGSDDLPTLVTCIRKSLSELSSKYVEKQSRDEAILAIPHDYMELSEAHYRGEVAMQITSLCGYQLYNVDFGWGRPSWLSVNQTATRNLVVLMDSRDGGGIDAWICLKDSETLSIFEHELELLLAI